MARRAALNEEKLRGLEAVFLGPQAGIPAKPQASKPEKQKVTFYLNPKAVELLEDLRLRLRREQGLSPSLASKSAIVEASLRLVQGDLVRLAQAVQEAG